MPKKGEYTLFEGLNLKTFFEDDFFEDDLLWNNSKISLKQIDNYLIKKIDEGESWSKHLKIYGNNEGNYLKIILENGFIASMSFRVNFTIDYSIFLNIIINFCEINKLLIVDNELNILPLDYQIIKDSLENSKVYKNYKSFGNGTE
ncbi:hypothetical protein [uncultured Kordia sp.]|uniref:hypothetical protein n=1 Tax=uncultured Kordia sp. TaxID=507699 RepID=UPI002609F63F|nr:hypothetical protein [uncultured Kordia sp.]